MILDIKVKRSQNKLYQNSIKTDLFYKEPVNLHFQPIIKIQSNLVIYLKRRIQHICSRGLSLDNSFLTELKSFWKNWFETILVLFFPNQKKKVKIKRNSQAQKFQVRNPSLQQFSIQFRVASTKWCIYLLTNMSCRSFTHMTVQHGCSNDAYEEVMLYPCTQMITRTHFVRCTFFFFFSAARASQPLFTSLFL